MGRTKNPNPQRRVRVQQEESKGSERTDYSATYTAGNIIVAEGATDNGVDDNREHEIILVPIGPGLTVPLSIPTRKPRPKKRKQILLQEEDDLNIELCLEDPEELIIDTGSKEVVISIQMKERESTVQKWKLLLQRELPGARLDFVSEGVNKSYSVVTAQAVNRLLRYVFGDHHDMSAVSLAMDDGTLDLQLDTNHGLIPTLSIFLTTMSEAVMAPSQVPMGTAKRAKRFVPVRNLQTALATLYPDTIIAAALQKKVGVAPITAKMIYGMVDNVQLAKYEEGGGYDRKEMKVDGLVPKLRPYQEAAVQWMLQREHGDFESDEWELAWIVIQGDAVVPLTSSHTTGLIYCPFAGWLAPSYKVAQEATRGTVPPVRGGILADSMGLGKTVEVIACVLANPLVKYDKNQSAIQIDKMSSNDCGQTIEPATLVRVEAPKSVNNELMTINRYGRCICGKDAHFKGCLSFVLCKYCKEPMHGICAGFQNEQQVITETTAEYTDDIGSKELVRLCAQERCPTCIFTNRSDGLLHSRATLIVTPPAILDQWEREIRRHSFVDKNVQTPLSQQVPPSGMQKHSTKQCLKVVVYPGIRNIFRSKQNTCNEGLGRPERHLVHPDILADADIVLMTFDALMGDLSHSDENPFIGNEESSMSLRARKRYRVVPSPLTSIKWWRVCLDEAQRVETPTATSARMALKLDTHHRWCISGTPIGRGKVEDLYGLLVFLRLEPFSSKSWFQSCLRAGNKEVMRMVQQLLHRVLWRSTKSSESVRIQMGIPAQVEKKVALRFSSIEKHFYDRQLEQTMLAATDMTGRSHGLKRRNSAKTDLLSQHVHRLRAACCHPQVGSTGLGRSIKKRKAGSQGVTGPMSLSVSSGVLTMDQILDRLIDDAKLQCEESQRLAIMHTNAMAALSRLKVEAKQRGANYEESDEKLLKKSCDLYQESLDLADQNSSPSAVIGEAIMTGCQGFLTPRKVVRDGKSIIHWKIRSDLDRLQLRAVWARYDFEGPSKKICELSVKSIARISAEFDEIGLLVLYPKDCSFQVSHSALGGEFVDVVTFTLDKGESKTFKGFRTNRSKAWRVVVKSYHDHEEYPSGEVISFVVGLHVDLFEPDIASDSLQRLHVLHNAALSMSSLQQLKLSSESNNGIHFAEMAGRIDQMQKECDKIESLYLDGARAVHSQNKQELDIAREQRKQSETDLVAACAKGSGRKISDVWDDSWWDDVLSNCYLNGTPNDREQLCLRVHNDLECFSQSQIGIEYKARNPRKRLPTFADVDGLQTGLSFRLADFLSEIGDRAFDKCMHTFSLLSTHPSEAEQLQNSHCMKCHSDWNQQGPECKHCKLETNLLKVEHDAMILCIVDSIWKWLKETKSGGRMSNARAAARVDERAEKFLSAIKAGGKEWQRAKKAWRIHLDLLNDIDEVNQCKGSMRLARQDEDLTRLTDDELNAIVVPVDIHTRLMDHAAKQAMALGTLRRHTHTLRYLKNQNKGRQEELEDRENRKGEDSKIEETKCIICLSSMEGERAVLACGHSFHHTPCIQNLIGGRNASHTMISCPLRCVIKTKRQEIMIASDRRKDDGSQRTREIQGSWGTKVTRLVCDLIDVSDLGEKSIVFSQWEDMLWVVEQALVANKVEYVRVKSLKKIGADIKQFRSSECTVLLLNVKNGAEGLTLIEATHIFMVEPLLNCGLDSQAISRIHRIGQTRKTYIHRFLIEDTIEMKIDKLRIERQEDQLEDSINEARQKHEIEGGGIDGGFSQEELQDLLKL